MKKPTKKELGIPYDDNHDPETGLFKKGNTAGGFITSENQHEYVAIREFKSKQTAILALEDAAKANRMDLRKDVSEYGWYAVLYHVASLILTAKDPKGLAELVKLLGNATGNLGREQSESDGSTTISKDVKDFIGNLADVVRYKERQ